MSPLVTPATSSTVVRPASTLRQPSSRRLRMPSSTAALAMPQLLAPLVGEFADFLGGDQQLEQARPGRGIPPAGTRGSRPAGRAACRPAIARRGNRRAAPRAWAGTAPCSAGRACGPAAGPSPPRPCWRPGTAPRPCRPAACRPPAASLVCSVLNTRWPVSEAWMAFSAVSRSRISPTRTMSGSCRRMLRSELPNVSPIFGCTWIWLMPSSWYSTGSSVVMIFVSSSADFQQRAVERGGLAGAGRAGHQDDAVRQADQLAGRSAYRSASMPSLRERELHGALVQQAAARSLRRGSWG